MSSKRNIEFAVLAALAVAFVLIAAAVYIPSLDLLGQENGGTFSVMLTDPPTVPTGVSDVYITYNKVGIHASDASSGQGWTILTETGQIDLMQTLNVSQTIAFGKISPGTYNAIGFNITNVLVTYGGTNYTADLVYGKNTLFIPIEGGITTTDTTQSAVLVDLTPKVLLLGSPTSPTFAFLPQARAYIVPSQSIPSQSHKIGGRHNLVRDFWWNQMVANSHFEISGVQLSPRSLNITVTNTGTAPIDFQLAAVTSRTSVSGGWAPPVTVSAVFVVEQNASLEILSGSNRAQAYNQISSGGYLLAPGTSVTFYYSGQIETGLLALSGVQATQTIVSGQTYVVTMFGNDRIAQYPVTAS
jgi:hypothetical protein